MDEKLYFNQRNVKVTQNKFFVENKSYLIDNIQSVSFMELEPRRWFSSICLISGLLLSVQENGLFALGGLLLTVGIAAGICTTDKYAVIIHTANGNEKVLVSSDNYQIQQVVVALETAIANKSKHKEITYGTDTYDNNLELFEYPSRVPISPD